MELLRNFLKFDGILRNLIYEGILHVMQLLRNFAEFGFIQEFFT